MLLRRFLHDGFHVGTVVFGQDALASEYSNAQEVQRKERRKRAKRRKRDPYRKQQNKNTNISIARNDLTFITNYVHLTNHYPAIAS